MHDHNECEHEFKYCSKCDTVYCEKCGKEWYNTKITYNPNVFTYPYIGDGTVSITLSNDHIHANI